MMKFEEFIEKLWQFVSTETYLGGFGVENSLLRSSIIVPFSLISPCDL